MAPSRGPFKPPKVTSSIEFEAMLENMTESSSDDDEDISLHSAKPGDSLSPRTTEAVFSHLLQEQDDEASSSAAFSPPDRDSIGPLESSLESPASSLCATGPRRLPPREAVPASPRTPGGSLLEAAAAASPRPSGGSPRSPPRGGDALSPRSPGGDGDDAFSPRSPTKNGGDAFSPRSPTKNGDDAFSPRSPTKNGEPRRRRRRRIEPGTWKIANVIGQGSFGAIYLGLNMNTGELMAVKELPIRRARDVAELRHGRRGRTRSTRGRAIAPLDARIVSRRRMTMIPRAAARARISAQCFASAVTLRFMRSSTSTVMRFAFS